MGLIPEPDEAEWAQKLADAAIKQIKLHNSRVVTADSSGKIRLATEYLGNIYSEYRQLSKPPIIPSTSDMISDLRTARQKLLAIRSLLKDVPTSFIIQYEFRNRKEAVKFADVVGTVSAMVAAAEQFDRPLDPGVKRNHDLNRVIHSLAELYALLAERKFSRTLKVNQAGEFASDGPEFVRQIMIALDPDIKISTVATALKTFKSRGK